MRISLLLLCCLSLVCCETQGTVERDSMGKYPISENELFFEDQEIEPPRTGEPPAPPSNDIEKGSKIIKNGNMIFEVRKLESAKLQIDSMLTAYKGYYENEQYNSYHRSISYTLKMRIPNSRFDELVNKLEYGLGEMTSKQITAKDVTEQFVDLTIRLDNNLSYLKQYKEILKKAKSVKEILEVQEKIRRIEEEIESKKGRLKYLGDQVKYSTLNIEISQEVENEQAVGPGFGSELLNAFGDGFRWFLNFVIGMVSFWPFIVLGVLLVWSRKWVFRRFRRKVNVE